MNDNTTASQRLTIAIEELARVGVIRSQNDVARKMGITPSTLSMAMTGMRKPGTDLLLKFCDLYPVNFWWLLRGEGDMREDKIAALRRKISELQEEVHKLRKGKD